MTDRFIKARFALQPDQNETITNISMKHYSASLVKPIDFIQLVGTIRVNTVKEDSRGQLCLIFKHPPSVNAYKVIKNFLKSKTIDFMKVHENKYEYEMKDKLYIHEFLKFCIDNDIQPIFFSDAMYVIIYHTLAEANFFTNKEIRYSRAELIHAYVEQTFSILSNNEEKEKQINVEATEDSIVNKHDNSYEFGITNEEGEIQGAFDRKAANIVSNFSRSNSDEELIEQEMDAQCEKLVPKSICQEDSSHGAFYPSVVEDDLKLLCGFKPPLHDCNETRVTNDNVALVTPRIEHVMGYNSNSKELTEDNIPGIKHVH